MKHGSTLSLSGSVYSDNSIAVIETKEDKIAKMRALKAQKGKKTKKNL